VLSRSHARPTLTVNLARFTTGSGSENRSHYAGSDRVFSDSCVLYLKLLYTIVRSSGDTVASRT